MAKKKNTINSRNKGAITFNYFSKQKAFVLILDPEE